MSQRTENQALQPPSGWGHEVYETFGLDVVMVAVVEAVLGLIAVIVLGSMFGSF